MRVTNVRSRVIAGVRNLRSRCWRALRLGMRSSAAAMRARSASTRPASTCDRWVRLVSIGEHQRDGVVHRHVGMGWRAGTIQQTAEEF